MPKVGRRRTRENPKKEREAGGGGAQGEKTPKAGGRRTRGNPEKEREAGGGGAQGEKEKMPKAGRRRTRGNPDPETEREAKKRSLAEEASPGALHARASAMFAAFEHGDAPQSEAKPGDFCPISSSRQIVASMFIGVYLFLLDDCCSADHVYDVVESVAEESSGSPIPLLHEPYIPDELASHPGIHHAFELVEAKYNAEKGEIISSFPR